MKTLLMALFFLSLSGCRYIEVTVYNYADGTVVLDVDAELEAGKTVPINVAPEVSAPLIP